ncbi:MAG: hypothetical protein ABJE95_00685 [Byssovorax sp.]
MKTPTALLLALLGSSWLVACGSEVVDARAEGALDSGSSSSSSTGDPGCVGTACNAIEKPVMVSSGLMHACAVTHGGGLKC